MPIPLHREHTGKQILIVTQAFDPHADELLLLLRYMGQEPIRLNIEAVPADSLLSYRLARLPGCSPSHDPVNVDAVPQDLAHYTLFIDGRLIEAEQVGAVWWRRPGPYQFAGSLAPEEEALAVAETAAAMHSFWLALQAAGCFWISEPASLVQASNLPEQLRRAASLGFALPRSLVNTRPGEVQSFYRKCGGRLVYRMLSGGGVLPEEQRKRAGATAALIRQDHLASLESLVSVPAFFAECLPASRFYQIVVIGSQVYAAQSTGSLEAVPHWWSAQIAELSYEKDRKSV